MFGLEPTVDFAGPMTRTVEEVATVLECVAGLDGYDPRQVNLLAQLPKYTEALTMGVNGLKIGVLSEGSGFEGSERDVEEAVMEAISVLESAGAQAQRVSVPLHRKTLPALLAIYTEGGKHLIDTNFGGAFTKTYYPSSLMSTFGRLKQSHAGELPPNVKLNLLMGHYLEQQYQGRLYAKAQNVRPTFVKQYDQAFAEVDLLAMPTVPIKAPFWREPEDHEQALAHTLFGSELGPGNLMMANAAPFNYSGHPAISIPCGKSESLPIGLQLVAPYFREDRLIQASYAYEQSVDWASLVQVPAAAGG